MHLSTRISQSLHVERVLSEMYDKRHYIFYPLITSKKCNFSFPSCSQETGTLPNGEFEPGKQSFESLGSSILVIGAGGLGCEILKNLALTGFSDITVIDLDTIDVTNLNRQFLFRKDDVGRAKAEVAAEFVMKRVDTCSVKWHKAKIQDFDKEFYRGIQTVYETLDLHNQSTNQSIQFIHSFIHSFIHGFIHSFYLSICTHATQLLISLLIRL